MKYLIIGLGNFGSALGEKLTQRGHEVIGVDNSMAKVEAYKEKISHTICLDATDQHVVSGLPLKETDVCMVAIGEDTGANVMATAILKRLQVKRLVSRAITPLHETVLEAIGVDEIVHPEEETAERWAKKLNLKGVVDSFEVSGEFSIVEVRVSDKYAGKTLQEASFRRNYRLIVLTTIKNKSEKNLLGNLREVGETQGIATPDTILEKGDVMVMYGNIKDIRGLLKEE